MAVCTFFGHKMVNDGIEIELIHVLETLITEKNVTEFYVGNNGGFDSIVRRVLKNYISKKFPHISYSVVLAYLPCDTDPLTRGDFSDTIYPEGLEKVPRRAAIVWRNTWMLSRADFVVAYVNRVGGAYTFYQKAKKQGKTVINLCDDGC